MIRSRLIMCAAVAAFAGAAGPAAFAEHGGRPANLPPMGSANLSFIDGDGLVRGFERGAPGSVGILIYGWSFDGSNPDSPFLASSPTVTQTNGIMFPTQWLYAYNGTTFTYDRINVEALKNSPNMFVDSGRIAMFDDSTLTLTDSILRTDALGAGDRSTVKISNTQLSGELRMRSTGTMTLTQVTPFSRAAQPLNLHLIAEKGFTAITDSTLDGVVSRGRANITVAHSIIRNGVSHDRGALDPSLAPATTLELTDVGSLSAVIGTIRMTGGSVVGAVTVSGDASDPSRAGGIFIDTATVGGSISASKNGTVTTLGTFINGNVTVGDSTEASATIRLAGSEVAGNVQTVGRGILSINGFGSIGSSGTAVRGSGGIVTITNGQRIAGDVFAVGQSSVTIVNVGAIVGDAFADNSALLSLANTSARNVGAFSDSLLSMNRASASNVLVDRGTALLEGATIAHGISVFGKGQLSFDGGSTVGDSITNFGDSTGLVQIKSGSVGGDLVGLGSSITAMSGGHVEGSPVFREQATFLYSGGTFGFAGTLFPLSPGIASLQSDIATAASAEVFSTSSGFTALGDATIKFIGFDLQSTLLDPDYVQDDISYSVYQLTGQLADGSSIDGGLVYIQNAAGTARFMLIEAPPVPEPSVTALFIIGLSCLGFSRRARRAMRSGPYAGGQPSIRTESLAL